MKKTLLFAGLLAGLHAVMAQAPQIQWSKTYGGSESDVPRSIIPAAGGGYLMAGGSYSGNGDAMVSYGSSDVWVVRTNETGAISWQKKFGSTEFEEANCIIAAGDGGYLVGGFTDTGANGYNTYLLKLDENGNLPWQKTYGGSGTDKIYSLVATPDGGFLAAGSTSSTDGDITDAAESTDIWLLKLAADGTIEWQKTYGGSGVEDYAVATAATDGGFVVACSASSADGDLTGNHGQNDIWVFKTDAEGTIIWQGNFGGSLIDSPAGIAQAAGGGYYVTGYTQSNDGDVTGQHGTNDIWVLKLGATGALEWQKALGGTNMDGSSAVTPTADGGCIIAGSTLSTDGDVTATLGSFDYWVVKLTATGTISWQKSYGGSGLDSATAICMGQDGGIAIAGVANSNDGDVTNHHGAGDYWLLKLAPETAGLQDAGLSAFTVYPNPVKDVLHIANGTGKGTVTITDMMGKVVYTASHNLDGAEVKVNSLQQGMYTVTIDLNGSRVTHKFVKE